jgi:hypothetical protein
MASRPDAVSRRAFTADSASGVIQFVRHSALDRLVAVKGLPAWSLVSEAGRRRAEREAMGVAERSMKRLTGESIKRMLFRGEALDEGDLEYLRQVRDEFAEWPLGSNPPQALWFRARGLKRAAGLFFDIARYDDALACQQGELAVLEALDRLVAGAERAMADAARQAATPTQLEGLIHHYTLGLAQLVNIARDSNQLDEAVDHARRRLDVCREHLQAAPEATRIRASAIDAALSLAGIHGRRLEAAEAGAGIDAALLLAEQAVAAQIIDSARRRLDELAGG